MDALNAPFINEFASCWGLLAGSLVIASPVIFFKIKEHTDIEEDLKFSDEIFAEVAPDTPDMVEGTELEEAAKKQEDDITAPK
jgi:hypothetical protein